MFPGTKNAAVEKGKQNLCFKEHTSWQGGTVERKANHVSALANRGGETGSGWLVLEELFRARESEMAFPNTTVIRYLKTKKEPAFVKVQKRH